MAQETPIVEYISWNPAIGRILIHIKKGRDSFKLAHKLDELTLPALLKFVNEAVDNYDKYQVTKFREEAAYKRFDKTVLNAKDLIAMSGARIRAGRE